MFDFGIIEFIFIALVGLVFIGSKELPVMLYKLGLMLRSVNIMFQKARNDISDIMHEAELEHYRKQYKGDSILDAGSETADEDPVEKAEDK